MWIAIIIFVVFILGWFLWDRRKMERKIMKQGGMHKKYEKFISLTMQGHPKSKIFKETPSYICFGVASTFDQTIFELLMAFSKIQVDYKVNNQFLGRHKLHWEFQENEDQEYMYYKINEDIGSYLKNQKFFSEDT